jgi:hypothetical protein
MPRKSRKKQSKQPTQPTQPTQPNNSNATEKPEHSETSAYKPGDNKRRYDRQWYVEMSNLFMKLDSFTVEKNIYKIREEAQNAGQDLRITDTDELDPKDTVSQIRRLIKASMKPEKLSYIEKLVNLQDEVTAKRIQYLENEHEKLRALVDRLSETVFQFQDLNKTGQDHLYQQIERRINESEADMVDMTTTKIRDIETKIADLQKQVHTPKTKKSFFKSLGADASALPALLEQLEQI